MFAPALNEAKRPGSNITLAIALLCGTALGIGALEAPAHAQERDEEGEREEADANYSEGFVEAYRPVDELVKAEPQDIAAMKAAIPGVIAAIQTPDDRMAGGGLVYNIGLAADDLALQRQGLDLMIESGKLGADKLGQYLFNAGQLAYKAEDWTAARTRFSEALDANYTSGQDLEGIIAESYFQEQKYAEGLSYLKGVIDEKTAAGEKPSEDWLKRAISVAYKNNLADEAVAYSSAYAEFYPSPTSWGDAIAIQRTYFDYDNDVMLDLLRLADRTNSLRNSRDYVDYIDAADARRLPGEVKRVLDAGIASGGLEAGDAFVAEAKSIVDGRIDADQADLPSLEQDARAASSTAVTASAAGDVFLSYGMSAKAEEMYEIALTKSGVDVPRNTMRLGIAQADQGKTAEAAANFAKIEGDRKPVADLWGIYVASNGGAAESVSAPETTTPAETAEEPVEPAA